MVDRNAAIDQVFMVCKPEETKLQARMAEPGIGPIHLRWEEPTIAVNFIATRVPNRATRPYLPRSSSALEMRRQSAANLSRQMATGFGFDGCRVGTVVGIRSVRV